MSEAAAGLVKRDRAITVSALTTLCTLAWLQIVTGAGVGASAWDMTTLALFPHRQGINAMAAMPGMAIDGVALGAMRSAPAWGLAAWTLAITMWWTMMIAMMTPSAAPTILLYARVLNHHALARSEGKLAPTGAFAAGYFLIWLGFSVLAAGLHWLLERVGIISAVTMTSQSRWLSSAVLIAAGAYQLSPLKNVCLSHCRSAASFLSRHWRPHALGALRLGAMHGAYCVGCCWMLMSLLFVGGVMNLVWIAALALLFLIEKVLPRGHLIGRSAGVVLIAWGIATLLV